MARVRRRNPVSSVLLLMAAVVLAACSGGNLSPATPVATEAVTADVDQSRAHYADRIVNLMITNTSDRPLLVMSATLHSPLYEGATDWKPTRSGGTKVSAGTTVSLPAELPPAACSAGSTGEPAAPRITVTTDSEETGLTTVDVVAGDPHNVLTRNHAQDCLAQAAAAVAGLRVDHDLAVLPGSRTAVVGIDVQPTGGNAALVIEAFGTTTLLDEDSGHPWPRDTRVAGSDPASQLALHVTPMRCDPHAIAEDKAGTLIPVSITAGSRSGILRLEPEQDFVRQVYEFVLGACRTAGR